MDQLLVLNHDTHTLTFQHKTERDQVVGYPLELWTGQAGKRCREVFAFMERVYQHAAADEEESRRAGGDSGGGGGSGSSSEVGCVVCFVICLDRHDTGWH